MDHLLALTADGFVYTWGNGEQGRRIIRVVSLLTLPLGQLGRKIIQRSESANTASKTC